MEGSVQPAEGAGTPAPKKPKTLIYVAVAVAAIIVVAVIAVVALGGGGTQSTNTYSPKAGDYIHYKMDMSGGGFTTTSWMNVTIKSVASDSMVVNTTITSLGLGEISNETTVPLNKTMVPTYDPNNPPEGTTVTKVGSESISTKWGNKVCDHYKFSAEGVTTDVWTAGGMFIKAQAGQSGTTVTVTIDDTNISAITG